MATDENLGKLLQKNIEASNRTTHAIRALVRFLFIQLAFLTAAYVIWQIGLQFPDEENCAFEGFGCQPNGFVIFLVSALIIAGVIFSSRAGWHELSLSEVPGHPLSPSGNVSSSPKGSTGEKKSLKTWLRE